MITPGAPDFDPAAAHPELIALRSVIQARDWSGVEAFFDGLPDQSARGFFAGQVGDVAGSEDFLADRVRDEGSPGLAHTLLGSRYIQIGWDIRTSKRAQYVSREQFAALHEYLRRAERLLIDATAARPDNLAAWNARLTTAMGLQLGKNEALRRYAQLARHDPHNIIAQRRMVQLLCPKWSGSWEALFAFVRQCAAQAPPGSLSPSVVAEAHVERYLDLKGAERKQYLVQAHPELCAVALRSVGDPGYRPQYGWVAAHSVFAYLFSEASDYPRAAYHFRALGNLAGKYPWTNYPDGVAKFVNSRNTALAKG